MKKRAFIKSISSYLPERKVTNEHITKRLNGMGKHLNSKGLEKLFGIRERRYARPSEQVSDIAVNAASQIIEKEGKDTFDLLIFGAACSDMIEPATANIVQKKLGLDCSAMDIKNACNSVISSIEVAKAFIESGAYNNILIACGEKLSIAVKFNVENETDLKKRLAAYSLGDGGCALHIAASMDKSGIYFHRSKTIGEHWELCTIEGGGSLFPRDPEKMYFEGKTKELRNAFLKDGAPFLKECFRDMDFKIDEFDWVVTHQVSEESFDVIGSALNIPKGRILNVVEHFGNTAAASIPLAMEDAVSSGKLKKGDKVLMIGLAAGIHISCTAMIY